MGFVLGLGGAYHHDAAACLVQDGHIVAFAEEERFSRRKHHKDSRSCSNSTAYCLDEAGITLADVDEIGIAFQPSWPRRADHTDDVELIAELLDDRLFGGRRPKRLAIIEHHLAHAASAFHPSGFADAAVLVVDGSGDGVSTTIAHGTGDGLKVMRQWPFTQSLGWFYETVAEHLGLGDWTSSGKVMGLAGYGRPHYDLNFLRPESGGYRLDLSRFGLLASDSADRDYTNLRYYRRLKRAYAEAFIADGLPAHRRASQYDPVRGTATPDTAYTQAHADLAASAQRRLEECLSQLVTAALDATGSTRLCIAGGVGLNCSANGRLARLPAVQEMFVQPAAGDAGCAIGVALELARRRGDLTLPARPMRNCALGPSFTDADIRTTLDSCGLPYTDHGVDLPEVTAEHIATGAVAGWFQGRMEAGPRALGHRSILADPRKVAVRDRINNTIKHREPWRPLAPSILDTHAADLIGTAVPQPFMIVAHSATETARATIPAAVHTDGTVRPQTVVAGSASPYAVLLTAFAELTGGPPALLNTSFNHESEPIVCTPLDAIRTFASTPLDILAIGSFLVAKPGAATATRGAG